MADADDMLRSLAEKLKKKRLRASDLFRSIDASSDGIVSGQELRAALAELGFKPSDQEFAEFMAKVDKDGGGDVSLKEFDRALRYAERLPPKRKERRRTTIGEEDREEVRQIFCLFKQLCRAREQEDSEDPELVEWDESGSISVEELDQLLETVGLKFQRSEIESIVREADRDGNGEIDYQEFCDCMTRKIQVAYAPEDIAKSFKAFARNAPEGLIRVRDLRNALSTYMHRDAQDAEINELLLHYADSFVKLPGQDDVEYFNYQEYIDLMAPVRLSAE